jgi:hypothetical protein
VCVTVSWAAQLVLRAPLASEPHPAPASPASPASMSHHPPPPRDRRYLEGAGVIDALTTALVGLYESPTRPTAPLEFLASSVGGGGRAANELQLLRAENARLLAELDSLRAQLARFGVASPSAGAPPPPAASPKT